MMSIIFLHDLFIVVNHLISFDFFKRSINLILELKNPLRFDDEQDR